MARTRVIEPPDYLMDFKSPADVVDKALMEIAKKIKREWEAFVRTWENKPKFTIKKERDGYTIWADPSQGKPAEILGYVAEGTATRHAVMSKPFSAQTFVGQTFSAPGVGGVVFVSKKITLKGIDARHPEEVIAKKYDAMTVANLIQKEIDKFYR